MKRNQYFDHNHSQKALSCRYNMDTNRVEAQFNDGRMGKSAILHLTYLAS